MQGTSALFALSLALRKTKFNESRLPHVYEEEPALPLLHRKKMRVPRNFHRKYPLIKKTKMNNSQEVQQEYTRLIQLPSDTDAGKKRNRGYEFERLLNKLFLLEGLEPRTGYKPLGEQIDGTIYLDGRIYLIEAKWHADRQPASTLYQFKGKVDGKLLGTIGIFISMSGYAEDAVDALSLGKDLNVILVDRSDMDVAIIRKHGIKRVLQLKLRKAAEEGVIYFPTEGKLVTAKKTCAVEIESLRYDQILGEVVASQPVEPSTADLLIVCEGDSDRVVISVLAERILERAGSTRSIKILTAMGKVTIPRVANALWNNFHSESKVLIVIDGDNDPFGTENMLTTGLDFKEWVAAIPNPSIETWLNLDSDSLRRGGGKHRIALSREAAEQLDIDKLQASNEQFAQFYHAILDT